MNRSPSYLSRLTPLTRSTGRLIACLGLVLALWPASQQALAAGTPEASGVTPVSDGRHPYVLGESLPKAGSSKPATASGKDAQGSPSAEEEPAGAAPTPTASPRATTADTPSGDDTRLSDYEPMDWEALIPPDWEPLKDFQTMDFSSMSDNDPRAIRALRKLQAAWKNAPLNPAIKQEKIEISGFIIPLDSSTPDSIEELLLVPYFGACIHVPPPPSNQIIHVVLDKPLKGFQMMDPVTVRGELTPSRQDTPYGSSGYRLSAQQLSAYEEPAEMPLEEHH
ncbi:MAG: DUF3299 domain-containing protein [Lautropia sp.]|nr:DUF3299 domain-containing protein [Lautropia sp.]